MARPPIEATAKDTLVESPAAVDSHALADALQETERKLTACARLARLGYWEVDIRATRVSWSDGACAILGVPPAERSRSWAEFMELVYPDDRRLFDECEARIQRGEPGYRIAFRLSQGEGVRWAETIGEVIRDVDGKPVRIVGAVQDVTERELAARVLRGHQERLQLALESAGLGPWDWDLRTNTVTFWPEWKRQLGYGADEMTNGYEEWESRLHPDDRERVLTALSDYLKGRQPEYALEFRLRHKNGTYRWMYTRGVVLRDEAGRQSHMIGCHLDITERKQLEDQYRHSQKMQAVGQLAGGIAHDFNNLLVVINGYAELVSGQLGAVHPAQRSLEHIQAAATSAAALTRQLLAFSRRQILQPQVLDPNELLQRMHHLLRRVIDENISLVMTLSATGRVSVDPGQIDQVIMNLAINARDAMPDGGMLTIETADVDPDSALVADHAGMSPGGHVRIVVSDTGVGMDEATRGRVFEPFFTTKAAGRGTGLGLATVYGIVRQSGGSIWVDSEPGHGSTFTIDLPVVAAETRNAPPQTATTRELRGTETVLLLEDQAEVRELIEITLRRYGYTVIAASTGSEAIAAARALDGPIHLMLTDVVLPGTSGRVAARQVVAERPSTRVLYMSGYTDDVIVHHGVLEPGLAFLHKPFSGETLAQKIREVLATTEPPSYA